MDDRLLAGRAAAGDLDSFGQLYDRYLSRVYDFAWRTLRDTDGAEAVTRDVFERASREIAVAARAPSVASWLFGLTHAATIARAESVGVVPIGPAPLPEEAFGAFGVPDPLLLDDPGLVAADPELPGLIWEAVASLGPRDYAMLDLDQRQHLDAGEIGHITADDKAATQTIVARMRQAAGDVMASYVVARRGGEACPELATMVASHRLPPYSDEARRAVQAHVPTCDACAATLSMAGDPMKVFASFSTIAAPFALKGDLWRELASRWSGTAGGGAGVDLRASRGDLPLAAAGGAGGGAGGRGGGSFGGGSDDWTRNRMLLFGGAALGMVIFAFAIGAVIAGALGGGNGGGTTPGTQTATREPTVAGTPGKTSSPSVSIETATPDPNPSATATPEDTATPAPTPTPEPPTAIPATPTRTPRPGPTPTVTRTPRPSKTTPTPEPTATAVTP
jgi:DNA-directed RNA polymerase specialized sigma24 family protein